jgi:hypothetical protein
MLEAIEISIEGGISMDMDDSRRVLLRLELSMRWWQQGCRPNPKKKAM